MSVRVRDGRSGRKAETIRALRGGLVVSCQAPASDPLSGPAAMALIARTVVAAGAVGIRAEGLDDLRAVRAAVSVPVIGLWKDGSDGGPYITPTLEHALAVAATGAEVVAIDGTARPRPDGMTLAATIAALHEASDCLVMADVSTLAEGRAAAGFGADLIGSTLSGYTPHSRQQQQPDLQLVAELSAQVGVPVIAEGRIRTPEHAREALEAGACAVVVGTAITRPSALTRQFVREMIDGSSP